MTSAGLTFLSWVRTGLISAVGAPTGGTGSLLDASLPLSATLPVVLTLDGGAAVSYDANVVGPGDVIGLDSRQVIRSDPAPGAVDVEPNYFAIVEFDRPDLPWMLTPNAPATAKLTDADARRGLRPWLCLVVVPDRALDPPTGVRPLPRLNVLDSELPDLSTAWLWAHAQVLTAAGDDLQTLIATKPERTLSRLVAPRRLREGTQYLACVVPTFDAGRRAGLGLEPHPGSSLTPAWTHGTRALDVQLPVYHSWRFSTSKTVGDFEMLARRMKAARFGAIGVRSLDVGHAGSDVPGPTGAAAPWVIDLEGAIVGDLIVPGAWAAQWKSTLQQAIALRLASSAQELAPPTYGSLQAGYPGAITTNQGPRWVRDLNLDPRYRATASLGTRIVQQHQEALVASAWEQTAEMREANRLLRQAQLARAVGESIEARISVGSNVTASRLLQMTRAVHNQVGAVNGGLTVATALSRNVAVEASVSLAFRRVARPVGPLARRLTTAPLSAPVARLGYSAGSATALRPTPQLKAVGGTVDFSQVSTGTAPESFATLTAARVSSPVFPWEPAAPVVAAPQKVPFGYLSDLVVITRETQLGRTAAGIARALDFDGLPQLGWEEIGSWSWPRGYAETHVDFAGHTGRLSIGLQPFGTIGDVETVTWTPGRVRELSAQRFTSHATHVPRSSIGITIAAADLSGTGRIDAIVDWVDIQLNTYRTVGIDLDTTTGAFRGGWTTPVGVMSGTTEVHGITAAGSQLCTVFPSSPFLNIQTLAADGSTTDGVRVDMKGLMPADVVGAAVAAADFGGGTGVDLLIFSVAGQSGDLRGEYRIAYDVQPSGTIGAWGEIRSVPIRMMGEQVCLLVGAASSATAQTRANRTQAFRNSAADTQTRQARIVAKSAPPAPASTVDATKLAGDVRAAIDPTVTVTASVAARLKLATAIDPATVSDPLQPLTLTPRFRYPTFELFRDAFQERLFPGASTLPDDRVTALFVNRSVIESFLVGLNHEMSRELLWRGFPVRHGTFFSQFWDAARDEISPIEGWDAQSQLGAHKPPATAKGSLLLVVRAELVRRIPDVTIYAAPAMVGGSGTGRTIDTSKRLDPIFSGRLNPDIRFFGFDLTAAQARGVSAQDGWYFVFQEHPTAPRFGLDEASSGYGTRPTTWAALQWPHVVASQADEDGLVYVDAGSASPLAGATIADGGSSSLQHRWGFSAAHMAHITVQRPVQIAIHGSDLIDPAVGP